MTQRIGRARTGRLSLVCAALLMVLATPSASAADHAPCRVRNISQETSGISLKRMVRNARDGDRLHVRGTCQGKILDHV